VQQIAGPGRPITSGGRPLSPNRTSRSPAVALATSSASCGVASTKWKTVPPSIPMGGRGWWVRTKTGVWNGGFGPHAPRHSWSAPTLVHGRSVAQTCRAYGLGADVGGVPFGGGVIDAGVPTGLTRRRPPEARGEQPLVQRLAGVAEVGVERDAFAGAEPVERDREVVDTDP
jgi:hypothetical protein